VGTPAIFSPPSILARIPARFRANLAGEAQLGCSSFSSACFFPVKVPLPS